jgi:ABC-type Na+ efflux pump permease subunit
MKFKFPKLRTWGVLLFVVAIVLLFGYIFGTASQFQSTYDPDIKRFSENSIDVAMANGSVKHETPTVYAPSSPSKAELLFPPSEEDLKKLSGPS